MNELFNLGIFLVDFLFLMLLQKYLHAWRGVFVELLLELSGMASTLFRLERSFDCGDKSSSRISSLSSSLAAASMPSSLSTWLSPFDVINETQITRIAKM